MALIFHFKCTLKCRLQFVSIWTILKFCGLVMGKVFQHQICKLGLFRRLQIGQAYCVP